MKIMFFNHSFFGGGVEKALLDVVKNIDTNKHDITIFVRSKEGDLRQQYLAIEGENIHIRQCFDYLKPGKSIFGKILNVSLIWVAEKCICRFPKIYYMIAIRDKFDIEVAYMHNEATAIIASSTNRKSKKIAWVHTDLRQIKTWKYYFGSRRKQKKYYKKFDKIICVSKHVRNCFEELLGAYKNIEVIFNPVDSYRITELSKEETRIIKKKKTICAVGRLSYEKNFDMLIHSHLRLLQSGVDHELWIVGEGPERANLEKLIKALGVENTVTLFGFCQNPYSFIAKADIMVMSSIYEGLPVTALETVILHKPMVSCCSVVAEVFGDYGCGIITERNEQALAEGMKKLMTNNKFYENCISETVKRSKELSLESVINQINNSLGI